MYMRCTWEDHCKHKNLVNKFDTLALWGLSNIINIYLLQAGLFRRWDADVRVPTSADLEKSRLFTVMVKTHPHEERPQRPGGRPHGQPKGRHSGCPSRVSGQQGLRLEGGLYNEFELFLSTQFQVVYDHDPKPKPSVWPSSLAVRVAVRLGEKGSCQSKLEFTRRT